MLFDEGHRLFFCGFGYTRTAWLRRCGLHGRSHAGWEKNKERTRPSTTTAAPAASATCTKAVGGKRAAAPTKLVGHLRGAALGDPFHVNRSLDQFFGNSFRRHRRGMYAYGRTARAAGFMTAIAALRKSGPIALRRARRERIFSICPGSTAGNARTPSPDQGSSASRLFANPPPPTLWKVSGRIVASSAPKIECRLLPGGHRALHQRFGRSASQMHLWIAPSNGPRTEGARIPDTECPIPSSSLTGVFSGPCRVVQVASEGKHRIAVFHSLRPQKMADPNLRSLRFNSNGISE